MTRQLRDKLKLTQKQLAEKLGVDKGTVYRWEARKQSPSNKNLQKIVDLEGWMMLDKDEIGKTFITPWFKASDDYPKWLKLQDKTCHDEYISQTDDYIIDKHNKIMDIFTNIYKFLRGL